MKKYRDRPWVQFKDSPWRMARRFLIRTTGLILFPLIIGTLCHLTPFALVLVLIKTCFAFLLSILWLLRDITDYKVVKEIRGWQTKKQA